MRGPIGFAGLLAFATVPAVAQDAGEIVYPPGSAFGIPPFEGAAVADDFAGFVNSETMDSVVIVDMPVEAYGEVSNGLRSPDALASQGIDAEKIEDIEMGGMKGVRIRGTQSAQGLNFPKCILVLRGRSATGMLTAQMPLADAGDACRLIADVSERGGPTAVEKLEALPYRLDALGGMRVVNVFAGTSVLLTKGPADTLPEGPDQPMMIISRSVGGTMPAAGQRAAFSERALRDLAGFSSVEIMEMSDVEIDGAPGIAILATATEESRGRQMRLVQWIRFGNDHTLRLIGQSTSQSWSENKERFDAVLAGLRVE